jgi:hypothetical protein
MTFTSNDEFELKSMEGQTARYRRAQPYAADAAELKAAEGRYRAPDLGKVFEILPETNGLAVRFEDAPDKVIHAEAVGRDRFMQSLLIVQLVRDASGKVTGFDYSSPLVRNIRFNRIGDRAATAAPAPVAKEVPTAPTQPKTTALRLEGLVGEYELAAGRTLTITLDNGQLFGQPSGGGAKLPLEFVSGTTFGATGRPITLTFKLGDDGKATSVVMSQNGNERTLPKVR